MSSATLVIPGRDGAAGESDARQTLGGAASGESLLTEVFPATTVAGRSR